MHIYCLSLWRLRRWWISSIASSCTTLRSASLHVKHYSTPTSTTVDQWNEHGNLTLPLLPTSPHPLNPPPSLHPPPPPHPPMRSTSLTTTTPTASTMSAQH